MNMFASRDIPYVIAEIASAHQGNEKACYQLIDDALMVGANGVKFQFYKYDVLSSPIYEKRKIHEKIHFTKEQRQGFVKQARSKGLDVWVDIFDRWGLGVAKSVANELAGVKIPPTVVLDEELVLQILSFGKPTLVGVGGYEDADIDFVMDIVSSFREQIILLYGYQGYPTREEDTSLARIPYLEKRYGLPVGFADHVDASDPLSSLLPEYAFLLGASVIEKHITRNRSEKGYDYFSALEPEEFSEMIERLQRCQRVLGGTNITNAQKDYLAHATRITVLSDMNPGDLLSLEDVNFRRTGETGSLLPNQAKELLPCVVVRPIKKDFGLMLEDIKPIQVGAIVLCRTGSERLPGKSQLMLSGAPSIERCLQNVAASKEAGVTILATSTGSEDAILEKNAQRVGVEFFCGSGEDPLQRMIEVSEKFKLDVVVRVTGDSPLVSFELMDLMIKEHVKVAAEYTRIQGPPLGTKCEVINVKTLKKIRGLAETNGYSEYMTFYFDQNPDEFKIHEVNCPEAYFEPDVRISLDYPEDYQTLVQIYETLELREDVSRLADVLQEVRARGVDNLPNRSVVPRYQKQEFKNNNLKKFVFQSQ